MLNRVFLMGRLTKDPEIRYTSETNLPIARFSLAVNRSFKNKSTGERETDFINCVAFNRTAEFMNNYLSKGRQIIVEGRIQTRNWEDNEGKRHYVTEVVADQVNFADSKSSNSTGMQTEVTGEDSGFFPVESDDELPFN